MASTIMHIAVANELYKKINKQLDINYYDYILGSISPDINKLINQDRTISHYQISNNNIPSLEVFLNKYKTSLTNSFNLGYLTHLYTDKLYYQEYYPLFIKEKFLTSTVKCLNGTTLNLNKDELKRLLYNDYTNLNIQLIDHYNLNLDIFYNDFIEPLTNIEEIQVSKLNLLIEQSGIIIQNLNTKKEYIIDISSIISFIDNTKEELYNYLIEQNII